MNFADFKKKNIFENNKNKNVIFYELFFSLNSMFNLIQFNLSISLINYIFSKLFKSFSMIKII